MSCCPYCDGDGCSVCSNSGLDFTRDTPTVERVPIFKSKDTTSNEECASRPQRRKDVPWVSRKVNIYDDGKRARLSVGEVKHLIGFEAILVKFIPWGYTTEVYLTFRYEKDDSWVAINPMLEQHMSTGEFYESEYCLGELV